MEATILKLEEKLRIAMINSDVDILDQLIDDELVFIGPTGMVATKEMDLNAHRSKIQKITSLTFSEQTLKINENQAIVTVLSKIEGTFDGTDISGSYRYLRIWNKTNDTWKIISGAVCKMS